MGTRQVAEALSGHRFAEVYEHLAEDVRWVLPGQATIEGRSAVVAACEATAAGMEQLASTEVLRFVCVADERTAAVDAVGRYTGTDGSVTVVSSADVYEFDDAGRLLRITSYAVELPDAPR
ncbi:MAG: hypothetical protein AVDCRST_MAG16-1354 [uncultured Frankineae bacterium]|uniref:SnoaL-like domain-containing protein n=1 Tax=uncultured Frankineae bacterium TaxID=437475 RepID=A0A6J4LF48_9ACTN|nr:MAG: hypothetical protein AVDCRST_MAG16-1354 [uncultured Frankineae bacterium]